AVVLFSIFTHLMEVPLGGLGWMLWSLSVKVEPPSEGHEPLFGAAGASRALAEDATAPGPAGAPGPARGEPGERRDPG
ncbi:MAG: UPF0104 family protein, partial [Micrococcales bacterium]|nr:UPF0104 family protein [Micrococcales bacterium]